MKSLIALSVKNAISKLTYAYYVALGNVALADTGKIDSKSIKGGFDNLSTFLTGALGVSGGVFVVIGALKLIPIIKSGEQNPEGVLDAIKMFIIALMLGGAATIVGWFS